VKSTTRDLLRIDAEVRKARTKALERAYPLLKQVAEILELEAIEPQATRAKRLRQEVGALLSVTPDGSPEFES
jgi:hypothetical protein